jgi:large subunit ribosomal protein L23
MNILVKPLITEKAMVDAASSRYTFLVDQKADKMAIAKEIGLVYGVTVTSVRTILMKGKSKRSLRKRKLFWAPDQKKAIVTLAKGQKIEVFDVTEKANA